MKKAKKKITAKNILALLENKHADDIFVPECKNGQTWNTHHKRLDAWAMKKSYSKPGMFGYEIKVSRSDFLGDEKWTEYLPLCNYFYFVAPSDVIAKNEISDGAGLLTVATTGTKLFTKVKAPRREIEFPKDLITYVLTSRAKITREQFEDVDPVTKWRRWLEERDVRKTLGYEVKGKIRKIAAEIEYENRKLQEKMTAYDLIERRLDELGFDINDPISMWQFEDRMNELMDEIPRGFEIKLRRASEDLVRIADAIGGMKS